MEGGLVRLKPDVGCGIRSVAFDPARVWPYHTPMATLTIRSTYALDRETVERLESLARQWNVSKSEALRRAIRAADLRSSAESRLTALDTLQASMRLSRRKAEAWIRDLRRERERVTRHIASRR